MPKCGKPYQLEIKVRDFLHGNYRKNCSSKCAHQRILSEETKDKIKKGVAESQEQEHLMHCLKCGKEFIKLGTGHGYCEDCIEKYKFKKQKRDHVKHNIGLHKVICENCGKEVYANDDRCRYCIDCAEKLNEWKFQTYSADGKKIFSKKHCERLSERVQKLMKDGKIKPWQSRSIKSYPEKFFEKVLRNNRH